MNVNLTGGFCSSGYGQVTLNLLAALDRQSHLAAIFPIGGLEIEDRFRGLVQAGLERAQFYDRTAPSVRIFHQWLLAQHVGKGKHVGFPIFELDLLTKVERHHLQAQDLLLVCSQWARNIIEANGVTTPVEVVPLGVDSQVFFPAPLNGGTTTFLHPGKFEIRKGGMEVIEAFERAFTPEDDVRLILHCYNPFMQQDKVERYNREWYEAALRSKMGGKTTITSGRFSTQESLAQLMVQADCGLFPSRAEGWNLELSEMLAMGRHCIATNYGGHTEFVTPQSCRLIEVDEVEPAYDGLYFHGQGNWAMFGESQKTQLVEYMRAIHREKQAGFLTLNQAGIERMRDFTWDSIARRLVGAISC